MALDNLDDWVIRANAATRAALQGFADRFGYDPEDNEIALVDGSPVLDPRLSPEVVAFFSVVDEISWPDIWNGYFIGPVSSVSEHFEEDDPASVLVNSEAHEAVFIGSDGGGAYFVADLAAGGVILHVIEGVIERGVLQGGVSQVAASLDEFLEILLENVADVTEGRVPKF